MDLADGHVKAVEYATEHKGVEVFNLGTGTPYSVLDIIHAFEDATGVKVKYEMGPRRAGDLPKFWADSTQGAESTWLACGKNSGRHVPGYLELAG